MAQFMTNIPRRKIYETMLVFEDAMLEMNILLYNQKSFDEFKDKFNNDAINKLKSSFIEIKALILMFIENRKYLDSNEFELDIKKLIEDKELISNLLNNPNLTDKLKKAIVNVEKNILNVEKIEDFDKTKEYFKILDEFNSNIPKLLEQRRDEMK